MRLEGTVHRGTRRETWICVTGSWADPPLHVRALRGPVFSKPASASLASERRRASGVGPKHRLGLLELKLGAVLRILSGSRASARPRSSTARAVSMTPAPRAPGSGGGRAPRDRPSPSTSSAARARQAIHLTGPRAGARPMKTLPTAMSSVRAPRRRRRRGDDARPSPRRRGRRARGGVPRRTAEAVEAGAVRRRTPRP